jgi:glycosyltransferase involved in cell wall biosynthesis
VFNGAQFIIQAIKSIEAQSYRPTKIIVIDDGSTDTTEEVVLKYAAHCALPIQYIKKENGGPSSARNAGLKAATSDYIAFLDADDEWHERKLEEQIAVFEASKFPDLGIVYCDYQIIDEAGRLLPFKTVMLDPSIQGDVSRRLLHGNFITGSDSAVLVKRKCFEKVGLFDETLVAFEDLDLWIRLSRYYQFDYASSELVKIRFHPNNAQKDEVRMFINMLRFYAKWTSALKGNRRVLREWAAEISTAITHRLPDTKYLIIANDTLTGPAKRRLFASTCGSLKLHVIVTITIDFTLRTISPLVMNVLRELTWFLARVKKILVA